MHQNDYYKSLGIDRNASPQAIKAAYRKLAFQYHPDRTGAEAAAAEKMKAINEAYAVLSHPGKRREYDRLRQRFGASAHGQFRQTYSEQDIFRGSDIHEIFEEMARSFGLRGGDDIFKEFYGQGYRTFEFKRPGFFARGFVFSGRSGKAAPQQRLDAMGNPLGRLSKFLLEKLSGAVLPEKGADLKDIIWVSPLLARQGGPYAFYHKKKTKKLVVKIPAGTKHGQRIRLAGMGVDGKGGAPTGDLYLTVKIKKSIHQKIKDFFRH